ncbi:glycosyltransferase family 4 protein [Winogradskyella tangerina]|uniref:glycosyltransferase family 4 protein n=1 Tax=Winogradskyella tangerina TaxID=2023240 RepID=UPI000DBE67AD|nr:glycosyltransferase family 4 protein [Winogradskyella tangerina]
MSETPKKKLLIVGPFGDFGGRELEASFVASIFEDRFDIRIFSTMHASKHSQLYNFIASPKVINLNDLLYEQSLFKFFAFISYLFNRKDKPTRDYLSNAINKKLGLRKKAVKIIEAQIDDCDAVLILAQVSSNYMGEIIETAKSAQKKIIFRTTNFIKLKSESDSEWLAKVDLFIHHSESNASRLQHLSTHNYQLIDQCSFNESSLLMLPNKTEIKSFLTVSRVVKQKNIDVLVKTFMREENKDLKLYVVGKGEQLAELKEMAANHSNIIFTGFVPNNELENYYKSVDCFIVSHFEFEAGPLTAIDAMAAGLPIVSAKTGAMPERLPTNEFTFDNTVESLNRTIQKVKDLKAEKITQISEFNRNRYLENYSVDEIRSQYKSAIFTVLND